MTLATRCSHCGTTFRLDQQALDVAEGWVRCGRCREVFNAIEGLFEARLTGLGDNQGMVEVDGATTHDVTPTRAEASIAADADGYEPTLPATLGMDASAGGVAEDAPVGATQGVNTGGDASAPEPPAAAGRVAAAPIAEADTNDVEGGATEAPPLTRGASDIETTPSVLDGAEPHVDDEAPTPRTDAQPDPSTREGPDTSTTANIDGEDDARDLEAARISLFGPESSPREQHEWLDTQVGADGLERMTLWADTSSGRKRRGTRRARPRVAAHRRDHDFELSATSIDVVGEALPSAEAVDQLLASNERDTNFADYEPTSGFEIPSRPTRRRRPSLRVAARVAAIVLGVGLALQFVLHARDSIAARWPATEVALDRLCTPFGCEVQAPRDIEALQVQSVSLQEAAGAGLYELKVVLVNGSDLRVRMPALDLRVSNARGETVARRVLTPAEIGHASARIAPGDEAQLRGLLRIEHAGIAGYEVSVFYP